MAREALRSHRQIGQKHTDTRYKGGEMKLAYYAWVGGRGAGYTELIMPGQERGGGNGVMTEAATQFCPFFGVTQCAAKKKAEEGF